MNLRKSLDFVDKFRMSLEQQNHSSTEKVFERARLSSWLQFALFCAITAYLASGYVALGVCLFLLSFNILCLVGRLVAIKQFEGSLNSELMTRQGLYLYAFSSSLMALTWSLVTLYTLYANGLSSSSFHLLVFVMAGVGVSSTFSLASHFYLSRLYLLSAMSWTLGLIPFFPESSFAVLVFSISLVFAFYVDNVARTLSRSLSDKTRKLELAHHEFDKLTQILEEIPGIVTVLDNDLNYIYASSPVEELTHGVSAKRLVGHKLGFLNQNREFVELVESFHRSEQSSFKKIIELENSLGEKRRYEIYGSKKAFSGSVLIFSLDVEERFALEEQLKLEQVKQANASRLAAVGEMAAGIAHEINNPLTVIMGKCAQIRRLNDKDVVDPVAIISVVQKIEETAERIAKIVRGLKSFSRDAGQMEQVPLPMRDLFEDALNVSYEKARLLGIDIRLCQEKETLVWANPVAANQIFLNLLNNAFDALEKIEPKWVQIDCFVQEQFLVIEFYDSGKGIPPEILERIWDPFFTTKEVGRGTGLGLGISKTLMEQMGGSISVKKECSNTCFVLKFPLAEAKRDAA